MPAVPAASRPGRAPVTILGRWIDCCYGSEWILASRVDFTRPGPSSLRRAVTALCAELLLEESEEGSVFLAAGGAISQMLGDSGEQSLDVPPLELGLDVLVEESERLLATRVLTATRLQQVDQVSLVHARLVGTRSIGSM